MGDTRQGRTRKPGRPQRLAHDATPLHTSSPDLTARIGWLLATSRLQQDGPFEDGNVFVEALADHGVATTRSTMSRWESGDIPVSFDAMTGYELVLGLRQGRLTSLVEYFRHAMPTDRRRGSGPVLDPTTSAFSAGFDDLLDRVDAGVASAVDWQHLGWHFAAAPHLHLQRDTWRTLARSIVTVVPRAVGVAYQQYNNAATEIARVARAQEHLVDAVQEYLSDPDAQVISQPFRLLDRIPTVRAGDLVLDMLENPTSGPSMLQAISMATLKVTRGDFTEQQRARLGMHVLRQWRDDPVVAPSRLAELIAVLPDGLRAALTDAATKAGQEGLGYAVEHGELPAAETARLSSEIAHGARSRTTHTPADHEDLMLRRLVRESLFHRDAERRHLANLLLAASPFRHGLCDELLDLLADSDRSADVRLSAAWAVRYFAGEQHRMRMLRFLDVPEENVAAPIALGFGHIGFNEVSDQVLRSSLGGTLTHLSRAKMFALGMSGSPGLSGIARSSTVPEWQRKAARWWESQGPAVHS